VNRPFSVVGIDHVVLKARDPARLVSFYEDALGCAVERRSGELTQLRAGRSLIDIVPGGPLDRSGVNMDHLSLCLDRFEPDEVVTWLAAHGVATGEIATRYGAAGFGISMYLTDPEGNELELRNIGA
jgi:glyoxylase I family protein